MTMDRMAMGVDLACPIAARRAKKAIQGHVDPAGKRDRPENRALTVSKVRKVRTARLGQTGRLVPPAYEARREPETQAHRAFKGQTGRLVLPDPSVNKACKANKASPALWDLSDLKDHWAN
jgi:hypothetical protein